MRAGQQPSSQWAAAPASLPWIEACRWGSAMNRVPPGLRGSEPRYRQVSHDLMRRIDSGEFARGDQLPVETELAREYKVNRLTIREALGELTRSGLVRRVQGRGSFVAPEPVHFLMSATSPSFTSLLRAQGSVYEQRLLDSRIDDDPTARRVLDASRAQLRCLDVLLVVDSEPWSWSQVWLRDARYPGADVAYRPGGNGSLTATLRERFGVEMERAWIEWGAVPADPDLAQVLEVAPGSPLLTFESLAVDQSSSPVLLNRRKVRSDRVRYRIDLR